MTEEERDLAGRLLADLAQAVVEMSFNLGEEVIATPARPTLEEFERYSATLQAEMDARLEAKKAVLAFMTRHRGDERQLMDVIADAPEVERQVVLDAIDRLGGFSVGATLA
jgi:hypothetical protein